MQVLKIILFIMLQMFFIQLGLANYRAPAVDPGVEIAPDQSDLPRNDNFNRKETAKFNFSQTQEVKYSWVETIVLSVPAFIALYLYFRKRDKKKKLKLVVNTNKKDLSKSKTSGTKKAA